MLIHVVLTIAVISCTGPSCWSPSNGSIIIQFQIDHGGDPALIPGILTELSTGLKTASCSVLYCAGLLLSTPVVVKAPANTVSLSPGSAAAIAVCIIALAAAVGYFVWRYRHVSHIP